MNGFTSFVRDHRVHDLFIAAVVVALFTAISHWHSETPGPSKWLNADRSSHLGAEYDSIARSIHDGNGFASPFDEPTGPTAWMPPVLPYVLAAFYYVADGDRSLVVSLVLVVKSLVLVLCGWQVLLVGRAQNCALLALILFVLGLCLEFFYLFQFTHDTWLILLSLLLLSVSLRRLELAARYSEVQWGAVGGLCVLCNPILGLVWGIGTVGAARGCLHLRLRAVTIAISVCMIIVLPWCIRCRVVLQTWVPIKSNATYEAWQSLCKDDDGLLDLRTLETHPWVCDGKERRDYRDLGEVTFVAEKQPEFLASLRQSPSEGVTRVIRRALVATQYYMPLFDEEAEYGVKIRRAIFFVPFASWCIVLCTYRRQPLYAKFLAWTYAAYLAPYVITSYYDRYGAPLIVVKLLLCLFAIRSLAAMRTT